LYNAVQELKNLGVNLPEVLLDGINRVEEDLIQNELLPALASIMNPIISQLQRELVLVVEYTPDEPVQVKITRKETQMEEEKEVNGKSKEHEELKKGRGADDIIWTPGLKKPFNYELSNPSEGAVSSPAILEPVTKKDVPETPTQKKQNKKIKPKKSRKKRVRLAVTFPDGTVITSRFASKTLCDTIEKIGIERVAELKIHQNGTMLVTKAKDARYQQNKISDGYYVLTHSKTEMKRYHLEEISRRLGLNLKITKVVPPLD